MKLHIWFIIWFFLQVHALTLSVCLTLAVFKAKRKENIISSCVFKIKKNFLSSYWILKTAMSMKLSKFYFFTLKLSTEKWKRTDCMLILTYYLQSLVPKIKVPINIYFDIFCRDISLKIYILIFVFFLFLYSLHKQCILRYMYN